MTGKLKIIFIDNFDSFSYNLVDELQLLGADTVVYRNDADPEYILMHARQLKDDGFKVMGVLSPGPASPQEANNLMAIIEKMKSRFPLLGICLGHQALGLSLGGKVTQAPEIAHGKASTIIHNGDYCFKDLPNPLRVARYHSLVVTDLPDKVKIIARHEDLIMAIYEEKLRLLGLQFHPESILTTYGRKILSNALDLLTNNLTN